MLIVDYNLIPLLLLGICPNNILQIPARDVNQLMADGPSMKNGVNAPKLVEVELSIQQELVPNLFLTRVVQTAPGMRVNPGTVTLIHVPAARSLWRMARQILISRHTIQETVLKWFVTPDFLL